MFLLQFGIFFFILVLVILSVYFYNFKLLRFDESKCDKDVMLYSFDIIVVPGKTLFNKVLFIVRFWSGEVYMLNHKVCKWQKEISVRISQVSGVF